MAGRGITDARWPQPAPALLPGAGYEYRAISDPDTLHALSEPFGAAENNRDGICEPGMKTGSLVTAFVNAWYQNTGVPVVGISASKGGSEIALWQGDSDYLSDALARFATAEDFLQQAHIPVRHRLLVWCQGETDGDKETPHEIYQARFHTLWSRCRRSGLETCFLIAIGQYNGIKGYDYTAIHAAQLELPRKEPGVVLVSDGFYGMRTRGLMKDSYDYYQQAYNEVGTEAGTAASCWLQQH